MSFIGISLAATQNSLPRYGHDSDDFLSLKFVKKIGHRLGISQEKRTWKENQQGACVSAFRRTFTGLQCMTQMQGFLLTHVVLVDFAMPLAKPLENFPPPPSFGLLAFPALLTSKASLDQGPILRIHLLLRYCCLYPSPLRE